MIRPPSRPLSLPAAGPRTHCVEGQGVSPVSPEARLSRGPCFAGHLGLCVRRGVQGVEPRRHPRILPAARRGVGPTLRAAEQAPVRRGDPADPTGPRHRAQRRQPRRRAVHVARQGLRLRDAGPGVEAQGLSTVPDRPAPHPAEGGPQLLEPGGAEPRDLARRSERQSTLREVLEAQD